MLRDRKFLLFPLLCLILVVPSVFGQTMTTTDQQSLVAPSTGGETGLFQMVNADTLKAGDWSFGVYYNRYDYRGASPTLDIFPANGLKEVIDVDDNQLSASLGYGLTNRWEISASVPYVSLKNDDSRSAGFINGFPYTGKFSDTGVGNVHIATKIALNDPMTSNSHVALSLFVNPSTGKRDTGISTGNTAYGLGLHWNSGMWNLAGTFAKIGDRPANRTPEGVSFSNPNQFRLDAGVNVPIGVWSATNWITEVNGIFYNGGDIKPRNPIYFVSGIRHWFGQSGWAVNGALRVNATQLNSPGDYLGGLFGLTYAPVHLAAMVPPPPAPTPVPPPPPPPPPAPVTPPPEPVAPPHQPQELRTDEIHFESGSARLTNIAKAILDDVALRMKQEPTSTAVVIGYTDNKEATGAGNDLDRRRAEAVRDYLVSRHGIDPSRITVQGHDAQEPVGDNNTAEGRLKNRRVVIRLIIP